MASKWKVSATQPWTYLDALGNPVNGFRVTILLEAYGEGHALNVPRLDPALIQKEAEALASTRDALAKL